MMTDAKISLDLAEMRDLLSELQMNSGSLSQMTRLYEEMRADFEANGDCPPYLSPVALGAFQRGIMALASALDRQVFELESKIMRAEDERKEASGTERIR